ncbi:hypothetical protein JRQ81_003409 [Phrynocephalus forsythii]|uniref:Carboxylesterase type B domain-containing protein n=1 Tax=Phrynocephalus forsythii TaxID=171643 RepID=A0A9Q0XN08_9SAUR|nr:hypothetical protein JRQ81_003409 [Phrynocephalus forsythii]
MMLHVLKCLIPFFLPGLTCASEEDTVVVTNSGSIRGKHLTTASGMVTAFLGIPYAEPPLGVLRFQKPLPHKPWSHVLEATNYGNSCYQASTEGSTYHAELYSEATMQLSEDCLFLNVWVPHPRPRTPTPVFVWIHGGGFILGSGSLDRSWLAATENIIVASMNYRLGSLGFLYLPPDAPGNAGLWDQHLALSWLRENMAAFGGDPSRITIGGQSAGGASIGFHLLSPASQPLFAQAAVQSGATISPWAWVNPEEAKVRGQTLGQIFSCPEEDHHAAVRCLQTKDPGEIVRKSATMVHNVLFNFPFVPTTDGEFLPGDPQKLLEAGNFFAKPVLTGFTPDEGTIFLYESVPGFTLSNESLINYKQLLQGLRLLLPEAPEIVIRAAAFIYSHGEHGEARYRDAMIRATGDHAFLCPVASVANRMAQAGSPVFAYIFTHRPAFIVAPDWIGVPHCAELPYLFGFKLSNSEDEVILSQRVMHYWGHFIRTGSPDGGNGKHWPAFTGQNFFHIGTELDPAEKTSPTRNSLGFLYLPPYAPGNIGLWDQHLALKWIRDNAEVFGGNPAQLTLVGHSAGAAMVGFHLLSPVSQPLFSHAVLQSGVPNAPWPWKSPEEAKQDAVSRSSMVGCANESHSAVVSCLQGIGIGDREFSHLTFVNSMTTDGEFLPDEPRKLLENASFHGKSVLTGITGDEGSTFVMLMDSAPKILTWERLLQGVMGTIQTGTDEAVSKVVAMKFSEGFQGPERYRLAFAQYMRDYFFVCSLDKFGAKMREAGIPVYVYSFDHRPSGSLWPEWVEVPFGTEILYLFGSFASALPTNRTDTEAEQALSHQVMRYWAEFARSGNPTGSTVNEVKWPLYNATDKNLFHISTGTPQMKPVSPAPLCDFLALHSLA